MPIYDFASHTRKTETEHLEPKPVVIVEGILIFAESADFGFARCESFCGHAG